MRPGLWRPPVAPSAAEQAVIKAVRRAKLFVFLREHRHELFDQQFQAELARAYVDSPKGQPPVPPARLALATIVQAYTGVSDDEVIEATVMDRRWQLVLDCLDADQPPFAKGTLVGFRKRLVEQNLDRALVERTVTLAARTKGFGARALRAALDSSPLWGAGRVEDTINLMGHALRKALGVIAVSQGWGQAAGTAIVAAQAGVPQLAAPSLKAALDRDWDDPAARDEALAQVLGFLDQVEAFVAGWAGGQAAARAVAVAHQVRDQDVDLSGPAPALVRGVAKDRRISVEDAQMRHGRKSRSVLFDGYKRHILRDLDSGLGAAVGITPANAPEASVTASLARHAGQFDVTEVLAELADGDFLCLDHAGEITAAYPFSALPTRHRVQISGNATVFAMCVVDALGVSAMTGRPVVIESADLSTGEPVTVNVDEADSIWDPATAVVYVGRTGGECTGPSALVCCGYMNFFATWAAAMAWAGSHPEITGGILDQGRARPASRHRHLRAATQLAPRASNLGSMAAKQTRHRLVRPVSLDGCDTTADVSQRRPAR